MVALGKRTFAPIAPSRGRIQIGHQHLLAQTVAMKQRVYYDALAIGAEHRAHHSRMMPFSGSPIGLPVSASHSRAVRSSDAVSLRSPWGLCVPKTSSVLIG